MIPDICETILSREGGWDSLSETRPRNKIIFLSLLVQVVCELIVRRILIRDQVVWRLLIQSDKQMSPKALFIWEDWERIGLAKIALALLCKGLSPSPIAHQT